MKDQRGNVILRFAIAVLVFLFVFVGVGMLVVNYRIGSLTKPYYMLLHNKAAEGEVISNFGKPDYVINDVNELQEYALGWEPKPPMVIERKVMIYHIITNFDEFRVFIHIDRDGHTNHVTVAGT